MNVDHLDGSELFERTACGQSGRQGMKATRQRDLHAVSQEGDEDVGLDPRFVLMEHRADRQITLEIAERLFDGDELYDLEKDSYEIHNLIDSASHRQIKEEIRVRIIEHIERTGDQRAGRLAHALTRALNNN